MKKWIFAIITTLVSMIVCSTLIVLVFGKTSSITLFIGAGISYFAGRYVYNHFKNQENNAT